MQLYWTMCSYIHKDIECGGFFFLLYTRQIHEFCEGWEGHYYSCYGLRQCRKQKPTRGRCLGTCIPEIFQNIDAPRWHFKHKFTLIKIFLFSQRRSKIGKPRFATKKLMQNQQFYQSCIYDWLEKLKHTPKQLATFTNRTLSFIVSTDISK